MFYTLINNIFHFVSKNLLLPNTHFYWIDLKCTYHHNHHLITRENAIEMPIMRNIANTHSK